MAAPFHSAWVSRPGGDGAGCARRACWPDRRGAATGAAGGLLASVTGLLEPQRQVARPQPRPAPGRDLSHLARWVASQAEGNRNAGLFWAANRALDGDPAADLSPLAAAARQAGLGDREITRTLDSARNGGRTSTHAPDHQAEPGEI